MDQQQSTQPQSPVLPVQPVQQPAQQPQPNLIPTTPAAPAAPTTGLSPKTKTIITISLLIFLFPVGLIFMWLWTKWKMWVKIIVTVLPFVFALFIMPAITLMMINPSKQFAQANNTKRQSDVRQLYNAIQAYQAENGSFPLAITDTEKEIKTNGADICAEIMPTFTPALPMDPTMESQTGVTSCTEYRTGYTVKTVNGKVVVSAPNAENNEVISTDK